ncbi:MAG: ABC transporter permease [Thermodesulfobacteriota bacterium]
MNLPGVVIQTWAFIFKNWIMAKRNVFSLFEILFWPVVGFFSVGLLTTFLELDLNRTGFILIGIISMSAIQVCQIDVAEALLYDLWAKSMKHTFMAPIHPYQLLLGSWLIGVIRSLVVFFLLSLFSFWIFDFSFLRPGLLPISLFLSGLFLTSAFVGMTVCILILVFGYKAEVAAWSLSSLMALVCGIYYPITILPTPLSEIAKAIPLTYFLAYFRSFYGFEEGFKNLLDWGFGLAGFYLILEIILFRLVLHRAKKTGMLLKLSE